MSQKRKVMMYRIQYLTQSYSGWMKLEIKKIEIMIYLSFFQLNLNLNIELIELNWLFLMFSRERKHWLNLNYQNVYWMFIETSVNS